MASRQRSLAFREFELRHRGEVDVYWRLAASATYAERWWASVPSAERPSRISDAAATDSPEARVRLSPEDFVANQFHVLLWARAYTLVAMITSFESYLRRALERALIVRPALLSEFEMQLTARDLAGPAEDGGLRQWIARRVADKLIRDKTHPEAYRRLDEVFKCGVSKAMAAKVEEWQRFTLLRNAIVHESRTVTSELVRAWPERYPLPGTLVVVDDRDLVRVHDLGFELAEALDRRYTTEVIGEADAAELVCQMYWKMSVRDAETAMQFVDEFIGYSLTQQRADELLRLAAAGSRGYP